MLKSALRNRHSGQCQHNKEMLGVTVTPQEYLMLSLEQAMWRSIILALTTENHLIRQQASGSKRQATPVKSNPVRKDSPAINIQVNAKTVTKVVKMKPNIGYCGCVKNSLYEHFIHYPIHNNGTSVDMLTKTVTASIQTGH